MADNGEYEGIFGRDVFQVGHRLPMPQPCDLHMMFLLLLLCPVLLLLLITLVVIALIVAGILLCLTLLAAKKVHELARGISESM